MEKNPANHEMSRDFSASTCILLILVLMAALFVRTTGLGEADLGFDETMHTYAALGLLDKGEPIMPSGSSYRRALLFTYSVALSFKLFGVSELSARIPSVVFGLLSVLLIFWMGRHFFGSRAGIIAALLAACLPFEIVQSRACRMYSMYQFFFLLSSFAFYKGIESTVGKSLPSKTKGFPYIAKLGINIPFLALSGLVLYFAYKIHPLAALFYCSVFLYLAFMTISFLVTEESGGDGDRRYLLFFVVWILCGVVTLVYPGNAKMVKSLFEFQPTWASSLQTYPGYYYGLFQSETLYPVLVFFALGLIQICSRFHKPGYYVFACAVVPLVVHSLMTNVQKPRYIYDIFPFILLMAAYAISNFVDGESSELRLRIGKRVKQGMFRRVYFVLGISLCLGAIVLPFYTGLRYGLGIDEVQAYRFGGQYNAEWRNGCEYVKGHKGEEDVMIASIPLAAEFAGCPKIEYNLDNGEIDQFIKVEGERWERHKFADAKCIIDLKDLQEVVSMHRRGWVIVDPQRFGSPSHVRDDVREFINRNMERHVLDGVGSIYIYSWDAGSGD